MVLFGIPRSLAYLFKQIHFPLFLLLIKPLFTGGLFNGFPSPGDSNAFLTLVTFNFLKNWEQR